MSQFEEIDLFQPRQLAVGAAILVIGIGGSAFEGGNLPLMIPNIIPDRLAAIATSAICRPALSDPF